jgi:hypothetical protein
MGQPPSATKRPYTMMHRWMPSNIPSPAAVYATLAVESWFKIMNGIRSGSLLRWGNKGVAAMR